MSEPTVATKDRKTRRLTIDGITVDFDPAAVDDFELLADLNDVINGDANGRFKIADVIRRLLGDQYQTVIDELRDPETGRVPVSKVEHFLVELFRKALPNSSRS
ncbi:hypothetical protein [Bifidobacterium phasiani]|uniref:Phage protein n=1 Tax=Bifidobacterium phasiani TaxID=2834431 RepID=A0ABS6W650_9BIFI|nr:hypothetical protein [Bifidobacterium phasiani]MBW3081966.1 hypothetical protein [Bifidobacterium phasiani]